MIASLTGYIRHTELSAFIIDVNGVGYRVHATGRIISQLAQSQSEVTVLTEMVVREDAMTLFGFTNEADRDAFTLLQTVQGVGAKAALSILNTLTPDELVQSILSGDKAMVSRADGVGPKIALRIINELAQKVGKISTFPVADGPVHQPAGDQQAGVMQDALSALGNLGYSRSEAFQAVSSLYHATPEITLSDLIAQALQQLGKSS